MNYRANLAYTSLFLMILALILLLILYLTPVESQKRGGTLTPPRELPFPPPMRLEEYISPEDIKQQELNHYLDLTPEKIKMILKISREYNSRVDTLEYGLPTAYYTKEELEKIARKAMDLNRDLHQWLKEKNFTVEIFLTLPENTTASYASLVAQVFSKYAPKLLDRVKLKVAYYIDRYHLLSPGYNASLEESVEVIREFLKRNMSIYVATLSYAQSRFELTREYLARLDPRLLDDILEKTEENS